MDFGGNNTDLMMRTDIPNGNNTQFINFNTGSTVPYSHVKISPFSPSNSTTLYIGTQSGKLFKSVNAQNTPFTTEITGSEFPTANISAIDFGETENTILVTFSNFGVSSVWLSLDGGSTWENKEGNLPDMPVRWAIVHPENENQVMLATETGIWATQNISENEPQWLPESTGMGSVRIDMLRFRPSDNTVLAATHGRGLYTCTYEALFTDLREVEGNEIVLSPNPAKDFISITFTNNSPISKVTIFDTSGKLVKEDIQHKNGKKINLSALKKGVYVARIESRGTTISEKFILE